MKEGGERGKVDRESQGRREERRKEEMAWESPDAMLFIFSMYHMCSNVSSLYLVYLLLLFRH